VHYPTRQVFDQLLADRATLLACHFCDCLRDSVGDFICFSPAGETVARSTWRTRCSGDPDFSVPPFNPSPTLPFVTKCPPVSVCYSGVQQHWIETDAPDVMSALASIPAK
jgi:hypothetical protein